MQGMAKFMVGTGGGMNYGEFQGPFQGGTIGNVKDLVDASDDEGR